MNSIDIPFTESKAKEIIEGWAAERDADAEITGLTRWDYQARPFWAARVVLRSRAIQLIFSRHSVHAHEDGSVIVVSAYEESGDENE